MEIQAKRVYYGGKYMRSKLERDWARFFDKIEIPYEYEKEFFTSWLTDFSIRQLNGKYIHCEVKPFDFTLFEKNFRGKEAMNFSFKQCGYGKALKYATLSNPVCLLGTSPFFSRASGVLSFGYYYGPLWPGHSQEMEFDTLAIKKDPDSGKYGLSLCLGDWDDLVSKDVERKGFLYKQTETELMILNSFPYA